MQTRECAFAGSFYPRARKDLERAIDSAIDSARISQDVSGAISYVSPHAGYVYSGKTAAHTFKAMHARINTTENVVVIGPNHTGVGTRISVSYSDWATPLGLSRSNQGLAREICDGSSMAEHDETAHEMEHSIEVQLPFLQRTGIGRRFVFICMGDQSLEACEDLGNAIIKSVGNSQGTAVLASSDFNHYESSDVGEIKDRQLFERLYRLDYKAFNSKVDEIRDTACGYGPITVAMMYARARGAGKGVLLNYSNSGEATGDFDEVVDYASFAFT